MYQRIREIIANLFNLKLTCPPSPTFGLSEARAVVEKLAERGVDLSRDVLTSARLINEVTGVDDRLDNEVNLEVNTAYQRYVEMMDKAEELERQAKHARTSAETHERERQTLKELAALFGVLTD